VISPSTIDPASLPSVALDDRRSLPSKPCIYFAIDARGVVQYIGRSANPRKRWRQHHCAPALAELPEVRIAYLRLDEDLLSEVEQALIEWFSPPLNRPSGLQPREPIYGEAKKRREITITAAGWDGFKALAASMELSASELVDRLGRGTIPLDPASGDVLTVIKRGNVHCKAVDAAGHQYACKRVEPTD